METSIIGWWFTIEPYVYIVFRSVEQPKTTRNTQA